MSPKDTALLIGFVAGLVGLALALLTAMMLETCP